jgi:hypothetical protein
MPVRLGISPIGWSIEHEDVALQPVDDGISRSAALLRRVIAAG